MPVYYAQENIILYFNCNLLLQRRDSVLEEEVQLFLDVVSAVRQLKAIGGFHQKIMPGKFLCKKISKIYICKYYCLFNNEKA